MLYAQAVEEIGLKSSSNVITIEFSNAPHCIARQATRGHFREGPRKTRGRRSRRRFVERGGEKRGYSEHQVRFRQPVTMPVGQKSMWTATHKLGTEARPGGGIFFSCRHFFFGNATGPSRSCLPADGAKSVFIESIQTTKHGNNCWGRGDTTKLLGCQT